MYWNSARSIVLAKLFIWSAIAGGVVLELVFIPITAEGLAAMYKEFEGDRWAIQIWLTALVLAGQVILFSISYLLSLVSLGRLISQLSTRWINVLIISCLSLAIIGVSFLFWLTFQGGATPSVALGLLGTSLLSATAALITHALKGILDEAISDRTELAGVI